MTALIVICGPTASGKSGLAIAIAQRIREQTSREQTSREQTSREQKDWAYRDAVILSADSRQIYREFDIGTAKPSAAEQAQVIHYLIDICDPTVTLTLADYQDQAQALIRTFHDSSDQPAELMPLLVGGTGLYIKSIIRGLKIPRVAPQAELRSQFKALGQPYAYALLKQVDAIAAQAIHPNDQVRTLRALEVFYVTGTPMTEQQGENPPSYPILQIGLDCGGLDALEKRIAHRMEQMVEMGFIQEVETLCQTYGADLPLMKTLGYQEIAQFLAGDCSLLEAKHLTVRHTRQFAKRQRTWFRSDPSIHWFDADAANVVDQVWETIQSFYSSVSTRIPA